uniref:Uncharacterized protein n=1 Tax=Knipowitschia caucasica TaxID=637954 RepID=A0AAV2LWV3_KNICA
MEKLDEVTVSILKAASIDERMLLTLNRDDLRDLFPGPEHFIRRKHVWSIIHPEEDHPVPQKPETTSPRVATASPRTADAYKSPLKTLQLPSPPEYVVYTDNLEFEARRAFIDSDSMKEENRASLILDAYPCFKELHHALGELRRILEPENKKFISQIKLRWEEFCSRVEFYGVSKKAMKPPMTMDKTEAHLALMKALPTLFPSPAHPPKKMGTPCQAFLHVLKPTEDPDSVLQKRSLPCPVVVFDGSKCVIAVE